MNLFKEKVRLFCISNIMISFVCTSFLGVKYDTTLMERDETNSTGEYVEVETEPASRLGDESVEATDSTKEVVEVKKVTTTKKAKKQTNVVTKKKVNNTVTYAPAKYSEVTGNAVVEYAKRYLGLRYVAGGNSLTKGTDCSGFTKLIYKEFGVTLSRAVKGQVGNGKYVRKADLKKGDLVFYNNGSGSVSHVGIYMGDGRVIHESNHRDGVKISSVNMMHYVTARRVINEKAIQQVEASIAANNNANNNTNNTSNTNTNTGNTTNTSESTNTTVNDNTSTSTEVVNNETTITPPETPTTEAPKVENTTPVVSEPNVSEENQ